MTSMVSNAYVYSHVGNSRKNQEDNFLLSQGKILSPDDRERIAQTRSCYLDKKIGQDDYCIVVSDGMGGYECGEEASFLTVSYLSKKYYELLNGNMIDKKVICDEITYLNEFVCKEAKKNIETQNMGATLCGVLSSKEQIFCFNVGDSRLYQYFNGILNQITVDNTEGQRLLNLGLLTEDEVKTFPKRKAIYKYIGKDVELIPDIYEINDINKGTMLLLCSDGLSDVLELEEIQDMLSKQFIKTEDKGKFLVEMAVERKPDAGDNITLIIIEY